MVVLSKRVISKSEMRVKDSHIKVKSLVLQKKQRQYTIESGEWIQLDIHIKYHCLCGSQHMPASHSDFSIRTQTCNKISLLTAGTMILDLFTSPVSKWVSGAKHSPWKKTYLLFVFQTQQQQQHSCRQACTSDCGNIRCAEAHRR